MQQIDMEYQAALCTKAWIQNPEIDYGAIAVDLDATGKHNYTLTPCRRDTTWLNGLQMGS